MSTNLNPVATLSKLALKRHDRGEGLGANETNVSRALGLKQLGASYFEVAPGEAAFPFHVHYGEDEIIFIVEGQAEYRFGDMAHTVGAGDMLSAPAGGPELAHQLTNTGSDTLKYFCVSDMPDVNVVERPEQGVIDIANRREDGPGRVLLDKP